MVQQNKVAFIIHGFGMGGAEKFFINVVNHFYQNGFQPIVILLSEEKLLLHELHPEISVYTILRSARYDIFVSFKIKKIILQHSINKVFCINTFSFFLAKIAFLFKKNVSFYLSLHTTRPFSTKYYFQNLIYFRFLTKSDTIIFLCENQRKYLEKTYYFSNPSAHIVYNGIDTSYFNPELFDTNDIVNFKEKLGFLLNDKIIIQVASLQNVKRHFDSIDALSILHKKHKVYAHLLLVGSGESIYTKSIKDYVENRFLDSYVHFVGNQSDVRKFYLISDAFTLTSNSETFSLAALEAMAFKLPCSLTDVGGAREMTIAGKTGLISKPEDPFSIASTWRIILMNNMKRQNIRDFILDKFKSERMLQQYLDLICV